MRCRPQPVDETFRSSTQTVLLGSHPQYSTPPSDGRCGVSGRGGRLVRSRHGSGVERASRSIDCLYQSQQEMPEVAVCRRRGIVDDRVTNRDPFVGGGVAVCEYADSAPVPAQQLQRRRCALQPPYGFHNTTAIVADLGYTIPTLWLIVGFLSHHRAIPPRLRRQILHRSGDRDRTRQPPAVTHALPQLLDIIKGTHAVPCHPERRAHCAPVAARRGRPALPAGPDRRTNGEDRKADFRLGYWLSTQAALPLSRTPL
ncbi:hypothetical protein SAMN04490220_0223 [Rhodococcus jostii]|uniref:Uncharacterized protein n=1 Tax=Rhodococcus jostii TaxID=132919 RepID=A0A1H4ILP3_RHOJO|nr:hypothetical protein SAMN04490220_0223 [Rhodococcus jostii]